MKPIMRSSLATAVLMAGAATVCVAHPAHAESGLGGLAVSAVRQAIIPGSGDTSPVLKNNTFDLPTARP